MAWKDTVFERQMLYDEIWTEPMTTVAQRYSLSDVGLRKICVKLAIPVPPRGYWARLAAGQPMEKQPLPQSEGPSTFVRSIRIDERNDEVEHHVASARLDGAAAPLLQEAAYQPPSCVADVGREAAYISKTMVKLKEVDGIISLSVGAWADIAVSEAARLRALMLLDKVAFAVKAASGVFHLKSRSQNEHAHLSQRHSDDDRGSFEIHGTRYFVRMKERMLKEEITEPVPARPQNRGRSRFAYEPDFSSIFRSKKYKFTPTGKLQLQVYRVACSYEIAKTEDTPHTIIEDKLFTLVEKVERLSLTKKIEEQLRQERKLESERKTKSWEAQKAQKDALLKQLEQYEQLARNLGRAESLRRLMEKIQELPSAQSPLKEEHIAQLTIMADWLDPTIAKRWPEIDDVPDKNPHFCKRDASTVLDSCV
ncbi:MAG: hypothetical protein A3I66_00010 [Burkholderiales bacterium RIFCSPLOWO2_02_FULL_57_36]|nr:MAG: hypothetical protein A3I66_00010 [Burkholderiales bacterium RIFCSPLOWO2_02_FULL_57_36]